MYIAKLYYNYRYSIIYINFSITYINASLLSLLIKGIIKAYSISTIT